VADLAERCCGHARLLADQLRAEGGVTILNHVVLNQVLVPFSLDGANITDEVMRGVQREGTRWMSGTQWDGEAAMRISFSNWRTTEDDIRRSAQAILTQMQVSSSA
jgi:glutamate/tyrosine decarboxylase-like PLP-dependent enzyme